MARGLGLVVCATALALGLALPASAARGIETGFVGLNKIGTPANGSVYGDMAAAGAEYVRIPVTWRNVAPIEPVDPGDPDDPGYHFDGLDSLIKQLTANGLTPILSIATAPDWALRQPDPSGWGRRPSPPKFAQFVKVVATRYSGTHVRPGDATPLPRVYNFQLWNEVNLPRFYLPQYVNGKLVSPDNYRELVNLTADRLRDVAVSPAELESKIIAGGLAPFHHSRGSGVGRNPGPLLFMREALERRMDFDAWSVHPYTPGPPTYSAYAAEDVTLGDLPEVRTVLNRYANRFPGGGRKELWVTEFAWDSRGPDPKGVPMKLHSRWVAEAIHRMWRSGVSVLTWFRVYDDPCAATVPGNAKRCDDGNAATPYDFWQSGLYACDDPATCLGYHAKPSLTAFRFPFVAYPYQSRPRIALWGRTPAGAPGAVQIERKQGDSWHQVRTLNPSSAGIFQATLRKAWRKGLLRAVFDPDDLSAESESSLAFDLERPQVRWPPEGVGAFGS